MVNRGREGEGVPVPPIRAPAYGVNRKTLPTLPQPKWRHIGYHQAAQLRPCPSCRRHVLAGRQYGSEVTADAGNISDIGELIARIQERATYDLVPQDYPPRLYFLPRGVSAIRRARSFAVVADHKCGESLPSEPAPKYSGLLVPVRKPATDEPPF